MVSAGRFLPVVAVACAALLVLPACSGRSGDAETPAAEQGGSDVVTTVYTVRGEIAALPAQGDPMSVLRVRHEAMPHFRGQDGSLGMDTMTMPFAPAPGLDLEPFGVGDKVMLTFEVDSDAETGMFVGFRASKLEPLDPATELDWTPLSAD